jgi:DNA gyrase subunit A
MSESSDISNNISKDISINIEDIMHSAYLQYSLSVNVGRAIPDVRDGLKPGNRRILYAMRQLGLGKSHSYTKCAKVVGEVIGNYHPHGDAAVYDTMVRMAQDFSMSAPLIDGQGNFGSIDGDAAAAYRYTECRMERLAEELLADLERETVDMTPTFDESTLEPSVLPARFPNLLVNGTTGIGVGMATNIPPHNLGEVINATVHLIDHPSASNRELMQHLPGPDFPTGACIMGINPIISLYETGRGVIKIRGKATIEEKNGREQIIITEIPYAVNKERMVKKIAALVNEKRITGISGLTDASSSRVGIRIIVEIKRQAMASVVLNQLYKHTAMESSFGSQLLVVDNNRPKTMNLRQVLQAYIDHRFEVITRRTRFELAKAEARAHILEGLLIAVQNIDEVVKIIRDSRTREEATNALIARFELSAKQTQAILDMRLHQLTGLAMEELQKEYDALMERINYYRELLASRELLMGVVKDELIEVRDKYPSPRRTEILPSEKELNIEDLIARGVSVVTISGTGYIKRVPVDTYRTQNRGGVGVMGMQTKDEDHVEHLITACTHDYIFFFTNRGQMHWLKVYEIPEGGRTGRGKAMVNLLEMADDECVRAMITVPDVDVEGINVVMATRKGVVKKTALNLFKNLRRKGIRSIVLDDDDDLIDARLTDGNQQILLSSKAGMACRFNESDARSMGRTTRGVRGMELRGPDGEMTTELVSMTVVDPEADLLVITKNGMGKRTHIGQGNAEADKDIIGGYRLTRRGGKGVTSIKLKTDDEVVGALQVTDGEELLMTTTNGQMVRISVSDIRAIGRSSQGVRIIRLREGDAISSVSLIQELDMEDEDAEVTEGDEALIEGSAADTDPDEDLDTDVDEDADEDVDEDIDEDQDEDLEEDEDIDEDDLSKE